MSGSAPSGSAAYKKRDGILAMASDHRSVTWTPKAGSGAETESLTIWVKDISNLQQTPASNPKVMLKVLVTPQTEGGQQQQYVFSFTSPNNARAEADKIRDTLSGAIAAVKAASTSEVPTPTPTPTPTPGGGSGAGPSTSMAMASAATSTTPTPWMDDENLKKDADLQQSLLRADPSLQRVFMESLRSKPDSVTSGQFVAQFWSSRVHLLRAHAIEKHQTRGAYNVLSTLKPRVEDNVTRLNISKEQIQLIFNQHPLVKRVYDENVPKLTEQQFWSRFFQSRLFKKLRGERVSESDPSDPVLDKYLRADEAADRATGTQTVPHFLDLEGNEENVSQRLGNRPNFDMRPAPVDKVPIIRTLNNMSEKIMANVAPIDRTGEPAADGPGGGGDKNEPTFNELQLRDLRGDQSRERLLLNVRDQSRFFAEVKDVETAEATAFARQDPDAILNSLRTDLEDVYPDRKNIRLGAIVEPEEDEDEDEDEDKKDQGRTKSLPGSKASMAAATAQVLSAIRERKSQSDTDPAVTASPSSSETYGLSAALYDRVILTHATTTEFLRQFWSAFLSGNPDRASEIAALVESLSRARERIQTVADEADSERNTEIEKLKQHARDVMAASGGTARGKSVRPNLAGVPGGAKVVNQLMAPTFVALERAVQEYQKALAEQTQTQTQTLT